MRQYKPEFLGKVMPVDNKEKMSKFLNDQYFSFNNIYDAIKEHSEDISDLILLESESNSLRIKIISENNILAKINSTKVKIDNDIISAG